MGPFVAIDSESGKIMMECGSCSCRRERGESEGDKISIRSCE